MEEKVQSIIDILKDRYPLSQCALHYDQDYELMIAVAFRPVHRCPGKPGHAGSLRRLSHAGGHGTGPH